MCYENVITGQSAGLANLVMHAGRIVKYLRHFLFFLFGYRLLPCKDVTVKDLFLSPGLWASGLKGSRDPAYAGFWRKINAGLEETISTVPYKSCGEGIVE